MNLGKVNITRIFIIAISVGIAIAIASATIGREIYGSSEQSLFSFSIVNFAGYLFFLIMPVEIAFIYYLHAGLSLSLLLLLAITTASVAQVTDYYIGRSFSARFIDKLIGRHRYEKAEYELQKYGNIVIILFNFLPLSSPIIMLAAGMLKLPFKQAFAYSLLGLTAKYLFICLFFL